MLTCQQRIRRLRMMEAMERAYDRGDSQITKDEDGTLKYLDRNGNVLVTASMQKVKT